LITYLAIGIIWHASAPLPASSTARRASFSRWFQQNAVSAQYQSQSQAPEIALERGFQLSAV
jgi:hypothetical protein